MNFHGWETIALKDLDFIADKILTARNIADFKEDENFLEILGNENSSIIILDFGCGIGRNTFGMSLKRPKWKFVGYDNENMISKTKPYVCIKYPDFKEFSSVSFSSEWQVVNTQQFDVIFCNLVLQHIYEKDLNIYLNDFRKMTHKLVVHGRRLNDDNGKNTWKILENNKYFPVNCNSFNGYSINGNPEEHFTCIYQW